MTNFIAATDKTENRISLVCRTASTPDRDWDLSRDAAARVIITEEVGVLAYAAATCSEDLGLDVERIIIDRAVCADRFLQLLTELPEEYRGDVLCIREDGSGFLSASARVSGRTLYSLSPKDVRFYLEMSQVVTGVVALRDSASTVAA